MLIPKEATSILLEMGIQLLRILKDLNEKDKLFKPQKPNKPKSKKGIKYDNSTKTNDKESSDNSD